MSVLIRFMSPHHLFINALTLDNTPRVKWNAEYFSERGSRRSGFIIGEIIYGVVGAPTAGGARLQVGSKAADTHVELGSELALSPFFSATSRPTIINLLREN